MSPVLSSAVQLRLLPLRLAGMFLMTRLTTIMFRTTGLILRPVISLIGIPLIVNVILVIVVVIVKLMIGEVASITNEPPSNTGGGALSETSTVKKRRKKKKRYDNSHVITLTSCLSLLVFPHIDWFVIALVSRFCE